MSITDEQIEAGARALAKWDGANNWPEMASEVRDDYIDGAHEILTAAAEAQQAEPSDAEELEAARAVLREFGRDGDYDPEYDYWEDAMRYAQAALLAAREVRRG